MADKYWFGGSANFNTAANWAGGAPAGSEFGLTATFNSGSNSITFARSIGSGNPGIQTGGTNVGSLIRDSNNNLIGTISGGTWPTYTLVANSAFTGLGVAVRFAANAANTAPGAGDNVFFTDKSSTTAYTVTFSATTTVTDFTVTSGGPIVTFSGTSALNISGSLSVGASSTTWSNTGTITFTSTTGTKTITTNGTVFTSPNITFNGVGGTWQLQDALNLSNTRTVTLTNGTLDLNSKTLVTGLFSSSGSTARGVKFGTGDSGAITVNGTSGTLWTTSTFTNFTVTNNGIVNVSSTATSGTAISVLPGAQTEASCLSYNFTSGSYTLTFLTTSTHNAGNVTFSGFTGTLNALSSVQLFKGLTITPTSATMTWTTSTSALTFAATSGTWDIDTNGKAMDQPIIFGAGAVSGGTWRLLSNFVSGTSTTASTRLTTLTIGTLNLNNFTYRGGLFNSTNSNVRTIAFGTGNITLVASGGTMWTTATFTNFTVTGTPTVNISNNSGTATTITPGALAETTQSLNYNFTTGNYILTLTAGNYRSINFTGYSGQLQNTVITVYGDYTLSSSMTFSGTTNGTTFASTSGTTRIIRLNTKAITFPITFDGVGGSWSLFDNLTCSSLVWNNGNLDLNNNNLNVSQFSASGSTRTFTFGTGSVIMNSSSAASNAVLTAPLTYTTPNSTFTFSGSVNSHTFTNLNFSGTNPPRIALPTGGGTITIGSVSADIVTTGFTGTLSVNGSPDFYNTTITAGFTLSLSNPTITFRTTSVNNTSVSIAPTFNRGNILFTPASGRTITLQNNFALPGCIFNGSGTLNLNGYTLTTGSVFSANGFITMNSGTITVTGNDAGYGGSIWSDNAPGNVEFTDTTGLIDFTSNSPKSMSTDAVNRLPSIAVSGIGAFSLYQSLNLTNISSTGATVYLNSGSTFDFTDFTLSGCTLTSTGGSGSPATISKTGGTVSVSNLNIIGITAIGTAIWNAYTSNGNTNGGGNNGWNFAAAVATLYRGIKSRAQAYLGIRTDSQLYKGVRTIGWV